MIAHRVSSIVKALLPLVLLLIGCSSEPASQCDSDPEEDARAATWDDPIEILDRYDGATFSELLDIEADGDNVWFCTGVIGLQVWDASDPAALWQQDELALSSGSQTYPRCQHVAVADDDRVYVSNRSSTISSQSFIAVVDGSNPAALSELGTLLTDDNVEGMHAVGDLLFVAAHEGGLIAYRRGDSSVLTELGRIRQGLTNPWTVRVRDGLAFVADGPGGVSVVDVSDPSAMTHVATLDVDGPVKDLELDGDRLLAAAGATGVALIDLSDPRAPALIEIENTPGSALALAVGSSAVYVSDWNDVRVFDYRDRSDLRLVGHQPVYQNDGLASRTLGVAARGDVFFSSNWTELVSYRFHPGVQAPDLVVAPQRLSLPDPADGEARAIATLRNDGQEPLEVSSIDVSQDSLSFENVEDAFVLEPGEQVIGSVLNESTSTAAITLWMALRSDDPDEPRKCLPIEANEAGFGLGDRLDDATRFGGVVGADQALSELRGGPVLLAYFATF